MKYFILVLIALVSFSCQPSESPEEAMKRIMDSTQAAQDSILKLELAQKKRSQDSIAAVRANVKNMCPELVPFFELSYRMTDILQGEGYSDSVNRRFDQMSDSILKMEAKILGPGFSKMDSACRKMFLDRMLEKTDELTKATLEKLK